MPLNLTLNNKKMLEEKTEKISTLKKHNFFVAF